MALARLVRELQEFDWHNLRDMESVGVWPGVVKSVIALCLFVLCTALGIWLDIRSLQAALNSWSAEEEALRAEYAAKAVIAADLVVHKAQALQSGETFAALLRQLPRQTDVPDLVDEVTATGLRSNLVFSRIELGEEMSQEFYIEQPIQLEVTGSYHDFGTFVGGVASLHRIMTLHDFKVTTIDESRALVMTITARTYRYRTEVEQNATALLSTPSH